jgi:hypothetical protein
MDELIRGTYGALAIVAIGLIGIKLLSLILDKKTPNHGHKPS